LGGAYWPLALDAAVWVLNKVSIVSLTSLPDADENDLSEPLNKAIPTEATPNKKDPLFLSKPKGIIELARVLY
jgi:hypothetical protein